MSQEKITVVDAMGLVGFAPSQVIKMTRAGTGQSIAENVFLTRTALPGDAETNLSCLNKLSGWAGHL